jgi:hypothetical protein
MTSLGANSMPTCPPHLPPNQVGSVALNSFFGFEPYKKSTFMNVESEDCAFELKANMKAIIVSILVFDMLTFLMVFNLGLTFFSTPQYFGLCNFLDSNSAYEPNLWSIWFICRIVEWFSKR